MSATLELGDRRIEYRWIEGTGPAAADLVMLHEGLGSTSLWKDFPERLAAATGARVLVYSRHGYGGSSLLAAPRRGPTTCTRKPASGCRRSSIVWACADRCCSATATAPPSH